jgi:hypothetical protein
MSIQALSREHEHTDTRSPEALHDATSHAITSTIVRVTPFALLMSLVVMHIVQLVPAALFVEVLMIAVSVYAISLRPTASLTPLGVGTRTNGEP